MEMEQACSQADLMDDDAMMLRTTSKASAEMCADTISNKESLLKQDIDGRTPLHYAILYGSSLDEIKLIIDADPTSNKESLLKQDKGGLTPLHQAIKSRSSPDVIKLLIDEDKES